METDIIYIQDEATGELVSFVGPDAEERAIAYAAGEEYE